MENAKKCSLKKHEENIAITYCVECNIYICVKNVMNLVNKYKSNNYDIFPNSFNFSISENSKNLLLSFIQKIKNIINPIIIVYEGNDEEIKRQLEEKLNSFDNYFEVVKSNLNSSDITTKTENSLNNLKNLVFQI